MQLNVTKRVKGKKAEINRIRREGGIPAVVYSKGETGREISVDRTEFQKVLNKLPSGTLSSVVFTLDIEGEKVQAIVKDVQYHVTTYAVLHLDFVQLFDDALVTLNIPIQCTGVVDCAGIKVGGVLRQVIRYLKVRTLPKHIPSSFELDVRELNIGQTKRLSDIAIPGEVSPLGDLKEVAVVIAKK